MKFCVWLQNKQMNKKGHFWCLVLQNMRWVKMDGILKYNTIKKVCQLWLLFTSGLYDRDEVRNFSLKLQRHWYVFLTSINQKGKKKKKNTTWDLFRSSALKQKLGWLCQAWCFNKTCIRDHIREIVLHWREEDWSSLGELREKGHRERSSPSVR